MTAENGLAHPNLTVAVGEGWESGRGSQVASPDVVVECPEQVLERVVVPFIVAPGQADEGPHLR